MVSLPITMRQICKTLIFTLLSLLLFSCRETSMEWYPVSPKDRPFVRWWWLGSAVDEKGLDFNLREFAEKGIGGVEITPIYGVKGNESHDLDYLSPAWMAALRYTIERGRELGVQVDMSNCTGWPFGGPWIGEESAAKAFAFDSDTSAFITVPTGQKVKRAAPGGVGFVMDHYSQDALGVYLSPFDSAFAASGCPYPSVFFNDSFEVYGSSWTDGLPDAFFRDHGYRIEDHIRAFARNDGSPESRQVIADYRNTLGRMYMDNFVRPWTDWAHSHGVRTRHQAHGAPANLIDVYAAADIPECETFGQTPFNIRGLHRTGATRLNDSDPAVFKFASSAAHLTGKRYTSCETLTWLTEHFHTTLALCKPEIDLVLASGVNHVVFHGAPYSPAGVEFPGWKFYASVNMSPTNTAIWDLSETLFRYVTRCQSFLSNGSPDADFLMYFPIQDIWNHDFDKQLRLLDIHKMYLTMPQFKADVLDVIGMGHDVDYISDAFLEGVTVRKGSLVTPAGIGYKALVLPSENEYMPSATRERIEALKAAGARILTMDEVKSCGIQAEPMMCVPDVHMVRRSNELGGKNYFIANLGPEDIHEAVLACQAEAVEIFDPMSGRKGFARMISQEDGLTRIRLDLPSGSSALLKTFPRAPRHGDAWTYLTPAGEPLDISRRPWTLDFVRSEPLMFQTHFELDSLVDWTTLPDGDAVEAVAEYGTRLEAADDCIWRIDLGDVRESAVVRIDGQPVDTLIAAPFRTDVRLEKGEHRLEIEVRNLPANRIARMDRDGAVWRIFKDENIASVTDLPRELRGTYAWWPLVPSGLMGPVTVTPMSVDNL